MEEELFAQGAIPMDTETERYCPECSTMKSFDCFYKDGRNSKGEVRYRRDCKDCYHSRRVEEKRAKRRAANRAAEAQKAKAKPRRKK